MDFDELRQNAEERNSLNSQYLEPIEAARLLYSDEKQIREFCLMINRAIANQEITYELKQVAVLVNHPKGAYWSRREDESKVIQRDDFIHFLEKENIIVDKTNRFFKWLYPQDNKLHASSEQNDIKLKKSEKQINVILEIIKKLNYEPMSIPDGGKTKIKTECEKFFPKLFNGSESFKNAWTKARQKNLVEMENHESYVNNKF